MAHPTASHAPGPPPGTAGAPQGAEESATRLGHYTWLEMRLFEVLGGWTSTVPELDVKVALDIQCYHHAWHAELWQERLPVGRSAGEGGLVRPPSPGVAAFFDALAGLDGPGATVERLAGVYRVLLPRKITAYTAHLGGANAVSDGPTTRALRLALHDEVEDWREGEALLQSRFDTPASVERAAAQLARLEGLLVAAGGLLPPL